AACSLLACSLRRRLPPPNFFFRASPSPGPLAAGAVIAGWIVTEVGRQPWVVYEVMRTESAVTAAESVNIFFGVIAAVYVALTIGTIYALRRFARQNREADERMGDAA
ncbi:MAG: cytochrome ubiquinol oxidase subunit I, partial [Miltoncostaeaceae bacterium]